MAPTIYLVRHAQGYHNLCVENHQMPDPDLTELGRQQCASLRANFPHHDKVTHLVASPIRRTIYTCLQSFAPASEAGKRVTALPLLQEVSTYPCDTGSDPDRLRAEFGDPAKVDLALVTDGWNDKSETGPWFPEMGKVEARARAARRWLRDLARRAGDDAHIVVVTHGGFLHFLTDDWDGHSIEKGELQSKVFAVDCPLWLVLLFQQRARYQVSLEALRTKSGRSKTLPSSSRLTFSTGSGWANAEYRTYHFVGLAGDDEMASIKETQESFRARRGSASGLTETEQMELRSIMKKQLDQEFPTSQQAIQEE